MKINELRRAVEYGTERGHKTLIVPLDLLAQLLDEDRIQFLRRRLELILTTTRETWKSESDRIAVCEHEAEHCLGVSRDW